MTERRPSFEVATAPLSGAPGVAVRGEVDIQTAPDLSAALEDAIRESEGVLVVDLSGTDFLDSTGLNVLLRARGLLGREDRELVLVCPAGPARRVFEIAGMIDVLALFGSREEAAAALRPAG
jgi:anti-sigma B factor antagonist